MSTLYIYTDQKAKKEVIRRHHYEVMMDATPKIVLKARICMFVDCGETPVLNVGFFSGIVPGDVFVQGTAIAVKDPDTQELLGLIHREGAVVKAIEVYPRFCVGKIVRGVITAGDALSLQEKIPVLPTSALPKPKRCRFWPWRRQ